MMARSAEIFVLEMIIGAHSYSGGVALRNSDVRPMYSRACVIARAPKLAMYVKFTALHLRSARSARV